jgi:ABC-2 type transport system ATP-binding protein
MDRHVRGLDVDTGPAIEWQAQDGLYHASPKYPLPGTRMRAGETVTTGTLAGPGPGGGDGPSDGNPAPSHELGRTAARGVVLPPGEETLSILGVPRARLTGTVTGATAFAFLELVDVAPDGSRVTVDDQVMPVSLGPGAFERTVDLHGVAWRLEPGHSLELEISTGSSQYAIPRTGPYAVSLSAALRLPLTKA